MYDSIYDDPSYAQFGVSDAVDDSGTNFPEFLAELGLDDAECYLMRNDGEVGLGFDWSSGQPPRVNCQAVESEGWLAKESYTSISVTANNGAAHLQRISAAAHGCGHPSRRWHSSRQSLRRQVAAVYAILFLDHYDMEIHAVAPEALLLRRARARKRKRQMRLERYCRHFAAITEHGDVIFDDRHEQDIHAQGRSQAVIQQPEALAQYLHRYGRVLLACGYVGRVRRLIRALAVLRAREVLAKSAHVRAIYRAYRQRVTHPRRRQARLPQPQFIRPLPPTAPLAPPLM